MDNIISGSSVRVQTMADATLRLTIDIEPNDAQKAFALFGRPGSSVALAALVPGYAAKSDAPVEPEKPKGGPLAKLAGQWCKDHRFQEWASQQEMYSTIDGGTPEEIARLFICETCDVESRADLDHYQFNANLFHERVREPFAAWLKAHT
jgi:hypothetical protein